MPKSQTLERDEFHRIPSFFRDHRPGLLFEHGLFRKSLPTLRDHAQVRSMIPKCNSDSEKIMLNKELTPDAHEGETIPRLLEFSTCPPRFRRVRFCWGL